MSLRNLLFTLAVPVLVTSGCDFETFDGPYDGMPVMEFHQVSEANSSPTASQPYALTAVEGATESTVRLQTNLIGPQQSADRTLSFTVVSDGTTAQEGVHYSLPSGTEYTLPANSSFGFIEITILSNSLDDGESRALRLELEGSTDGGIGAADNLDDFTVRIDGQ